MDEIVLDRCMVDWLRVTDWKSMLSEEKFLSVDNQRSVRRLNYFGEMYDGVFHGMGWQNNRHHFMMEITGGRADEVWMDFPEMAKCTRIDLQVTTKMKWSTLFDMAGELRKADWGGDKRGVFLRSKDDFTDTLEIGSRKKSNLFIRIYTKGMPDSQVVRFEAEYKHDGASGVWASLHDGITKSEILAQTIWAIPQVPTMRPFHAWAAEWENHNRKPLVKVKSKRKWLVNTVVPALWKAANGHGDKQWLIDELERILSHMRTNG